MEREIKFRAKRIDNNETVFGFLLIIDSRTYIFPFGAKVRHTAFFGENGSFGTLGSGDKPDIIGYGKEQEGKWLCEVKPESVQQFTGRLDFYKKEIYDGDYITFHVAGGKEDEPPLYHEKGHVKWNNQGVVYGVWSSMYCYDVIIIEEKI